MLLKPLKLTQQEIADVVAFLSTLSDGEPPRCVTLHHVTSYPVTPSDGWGMIPPGHLLRFDIPFRDA